MGRGIKRADVGGRMGSGVNVNAHLIHSNISTMGGTNFRKFIESQYLLNHNIQQGLILSHFPSSEIFSSDGRFHGKMYFDFICFADKMAKRRLPVISSSAPHVVVIKMRNDPSLVWNIEMISPPSKNSTHPPSNATK